MTVCRSEVLAGLLPRSVTAFQTDLVAPCPTRSRRQVEFRGGRACARAALRGLGVHQRVGRRPDRSPEWPPGTIGSISHCAHLAVAVAATDRDLSGLGVDVEEVADIGAALYPVLFTARERRLVRTHWHPHLAATLMSAKESAFKAWYPTSGTLLEFTDVEIEPELTAGRFCAQVLKPSATGARPPRIRGRFVTHGGHIFTAAWSRTPTTHGRLHLADAARRASGRPSPAP